MRGSSKILLPSRGCVNLSVGASTTSQASSVFYTHIKGDLWDGWGLKNVHTLQPMAVMGHGYGDMEFLY